MKHLFCWVLGLSLLMAVSLAFAQEAKDWAASASAKRMKNRVKPTEAAIQKGKEIYESKCAACHGVNGDGKGPAGAGLNPKPANFRESLAEKITDGEFFWKITTGRGPMPSFEKQLTRTERWEVINYIHTFKK
jgi:mono/diheme cytochrome c family protein